MKKHLLLFLFLSEITFSQLPNIAFNGTNAWTTNSNITFNNTLNQATITGNGINNVKSELLVSLPSTIPSEFYFVADIFLNGVVYNPENIKNPQLVVRDESGALIGRINLDAGLENQWFKSGVRIKNYNSSTLKLEISVNNTTGIMIVKNPVLVMTPPTFTYEFPFAIPADVSSSLTVDLNQNHLFKNDLLSTNSHFVYANYQWGDPNLNAAITTYFPMTNIRFPGGTVGNFYNYQTDTFYLNSNTPNNLYNIANNGYVFNYNGYKNLVVNTGATATLMLNVLTNSPLQSKAEYQSRVASGLPIEWIELGNEMYGASNQIGNITDVSTYISHTQQVSSEIKSVNPNVKVAVCLEKDDFNSGDWNETISQNQSYYDATTLHNYIAVGTYFYSKYDSYSMFNAYKLSMNRFNQYNTLFPNKPLLLTEWGITTETDPPYFIQTLGLADAFLAIEKANQLGIVHQAGTHMLYKNDENSEATLMFKGNGNQIRFTSKGIVYSKLFEVFKNAEVYNADVSSANLETDLKAIYGKMVKKGNQYKIFLVNKLPVASPFSLNVNGLTYIGNYTMETYTDDLSNPTNDVAATSNNWITTSSSGSINIPASSISIISILDSDLNILNTDEIGNFNKINIYPNPTKDIIYISDFSQQNYELSIYDFNGILLKKYNSNSLNQIQFIDLKALENGIYLLKIKDENNINIVKKIIKN